MSSFNFFRSFAQRHIPKYVCGLAVGSSLCLKPVKHTTIRLDYWEHDEKDFDLYVKNPTAEDLPILLKKFDEEGLEVWPWIWTHPNSNGPHFVFIGLNEFYIDEIKRIRAASPNNNILVVADEETLKKATKHHPGVLHQCQCGIVTDSSLALLNVKAKIMMLKDERVIAYDYLTIIEP